MSKKLFGTPAGDSTIVLIGIGEYKS